MATDPLLGIAEELYAVEPSAFTGTRNQWAKQAKADGDKELSARITELRKPSIAAWVVNMMVRHQAQEMSQVLDLGDSLRQAQSDLDGDALRELTRQRRALTTAVTRQGRTLAAELGQKITEQVADQVQATLHAAMVDEQAAAAVRSGLLVGALSATGVEAADVVDAVAVPAAIGMTARPRSRPAPRRPGLTVVPQPTAEAEPEQDRAEQQREEERKAAQAEVERARAEADEARKKVRKARKRQERTQARTLQAAEELEEVRRRAAELEHELEQLADDAEQTEQRRARAEQRYESAQEALESARARLDDLS